VRNRVVRLVAAEVAGTLIGCGWTGDLPTPKTGARVGGANCSAGVGVAYAPAVWVPPFRPGDPITCLPDPGLGYEVDFSVELDAWGDVVAIRVPEGEPDWLLSCLQSAGRDWLFLPAHDCRGRPVASTIRMVAGPYRWAYERP
jgi:hypothetical protein